jgi:hypothetical protein
VALIPALFATAAWYAWEFSAGAIPFVGGIAILGHSGVALGVALRRRRTGKDEAHA